MLKERSFVLGLIAFAVTLVVLLLHQAISTPPIRHVLSAPIVDLDEGQMTEADSAVDPET